MLNQLQRAQTRVLLLEGVHDKSREWMERFGFSDITEVKGALDPLELPGYLSQADIIGIRSRTQLTEDLLKEARHLLAIGCFCIGTNQVNLEAAQMLGIPVFNAPHANTRSVAEMVLGLTVMLMRQVFPRSMELHRGEWKKNAKGCYEVRGKTMGIVGYGHIGSQVSVLAEALGMNVLYYDIDSVLPMGNATSVPSLRDLLLNSDVVSLHVPQTRQTRDMIGKDECALMKKGSVLINASRGNVVQIEPLVEALKCDQLKGAAIDVFPEEPKTNSDPFDSPLVGLEKVILTPHIGGSTVEAQANIGVDVASKLVNFVTKGSTVGAVNFPGLNLAAHENAHRVLHIHKNMPGVLRAINRVFANDEINILGQHLNTMNNLGYVVLDMEKKSISKLVPNLEAIEGTIKVRILS